MSRSFTSTNSIVSPEVQRSANLKHWSVLKPHFGPGLFVWILCILILLTPLADTVERKAILLVPAALFSLWVLLLRPQEGILVWVLALTLLVTQTGYQLDIGRLRTSALEVVLLILLPAIAYLRQVRSIAPGYRLPGARFFKWFILYAFVMLAASVMQGTVVQQALTQAKGFILYPLMAWVFLSADWNIKNLRVLVFLAVALYVVVAGTGIYQFFQYDSGGLRLVQISADYAAINIYGVTMMAMALLVLGISLQQQSKIAISAGTVVSFWLFLGAVASVSRTVWIAFAVGLLALFFAERKGRLLLILLLSLCLVLLFFYLPNPVTQRILQLSDSSTMKRAHYLESGWRAWLANPIFGWGWGRAYWYVRGVGLIHSHSFPWYHNDYLNLAVQTGVIGLGLYLAFWQRVLSAASDWLVQHKTAITVGYVRGSVAALAGLLTAAAFEHVLWRPDMAGLVGWMLGILLVSMRLGDKGQTS